MRKIRNHLYAVVLGWLIFAPSVTRADSLPIVDWAHGAKRGTIIKNYSSGAEASTLPVCVAKLSADERLARHFAEIEYRHGRTLFREVGEIPEDVPTQVGNEVEIYPKDCERGTISRVTRLLKLAN